MRRIFFIATLILALGVLASCDQAVPTAPAPCALASGGEWEFLGLQADSLAYVRAVTTDPSNPARILAGTASDFTGGQAGRLFLSEDDGMSWKQVLFGGRSFTAVFFDPVNPSIVYAATSFTVFKSSDSGRNWTPTSDDICTDFESFMQMLKYAPEGALYAGVTSLNGSCTRTLYRSTDGAQSWDDLCEGQGSECLPNGPTAFGVDPTNPLGSLRA